MLETIKIDGVEYDLTPKTKPEPDCWIKEKYATGNHIMIRRDEPSAHEYIFRTEACRKHGFKVIENNWYIIEPKETYIYYPLFEHKLIHKKHKDILDAYLADNNVEIEYNRHESGFELICGDFIEHYDESLDYRLKPQMQVSNIQRKQSWRSV